MYNRPYSAAAWNGSEVADRELGGQRVGEAARNPRLTLREPRPAFAPPFVHVDRAVQLKLNGVQSGCWIAVMHFGDETAGIEGLLRPTE